MTLNVEDGTGKTDSDAYVSLEDCSAYTQARGLSFPTSPAGPAEAAIIRATAAIDATYRSRFSGEKVNGRQQALEWPRKNATDASGSNIDTDEVPFEIVEATCEAAVRELATPGAMMPDLERGEQIKSLQAGSVAIEYGSNASAQTTFSLIDGILSGLIGGGNGGLFATAVRG